MEPQAFDLETECRQLIERFRTLILATTDEVGAPDASTVPYLLSSGFVILVSELAKHTSHLLGTGRCVVLFPENEDEAVNLFARKRLTVGCRVTELDRGNPQTELLLDQLAAEIGPVVGMLRQLPDFHLLRLEPMSCNYVRGFGQAYRFEPQDHPGLWGDSAVAGSEVGGARVDGE